MQKELRIGTTANDDKTLESRAKFFSFSHRNEIVNQNKEQLLKVINELEYTKSRSDRENRTLEVELAASKEEMAGLESDLTSITFDSARLQAKLKSLKRELESQTNTAVDLNAGMVVKKSRIQELEVFVFV